MVSTSHIHASIFRAYDIRGIVGKTLTEESVFLIGKAIGSYAREQGENQITIARDGRLSGPLLSKALTEGLLSVGCEVIDLGMVPTPVLYFATTQYISELSPEISSEEIAHHPAPLSACHPAFIAGSGIMLTGSHNPADYNGLKIVIKGTTLTENEIKNLYHRILEQNFHTGCGKRRNYQIVDKYVERITSDIQLARPLRIVIDAGNGVTGELAPRLFRALGCEVEELFCEIDGRFPNHHPDPSEPHHLTALIKKVRDNHADIGLAFDGDGDRLGVITNQGEIIWPDRLLMLFARAILAEVPHGKIIYDVKCTHHLDTLIRSLQGEPIMWKTGHSLIKAKLAETNAQLAGEMSGHFFFKHRWYGFDDALYAGARLLEILGQHQIDSHTLFATIPNSVNTAELRVSVSDEEKFNLMHQLIEGAHFATAKNIMTIDGLRVNFQDGWGLVRPSNTTPYLILRFEAINEMILDEIQTLFRQWMLSIKPDLVLPF